VDILSALFVENINFRQAPGPSTRIDLSGVMFSMAAEGDLPVSIEPHLIVLVRCPPEEDGNAVLETVFRKANREDWSKANREDWSKANREGSGNANEEPSKDSSGEQVARNVQPFQVEPGKFGYRLVKADLTYNEYGTIEAHCRLNDGPWHIVPLTLLPPVA
jgi:hypothetical protein